MPVAAAKGSGAATTHKILKIGTTRISAAKAAPVKNGNLTGEARPDPDSAVAEADKGAQIRNPIGSSRVPSDFVPRPAPQAVQADVTPLDFEGLNHFDQRFALYGGTPNTQFSLEPPDQGLCVGGSYVLETVNTAVRVKTTDGGYVTDPMPLNEFFGQGPEVIRHTPPAPNGPYGQFTSDPKCYYDSATGHWFLSLLEIDVDSTTGDFSGRAHQLLAVTGSGGLLGSWNIYEWDTTNDGTNDTPSHSGCPCFGDQPLIGADANGFYVTTNEYPLFVAGFNGANIYALDKAALAAGAGTINSQYIYAPTLAEGQAYSLQPATTPPGGTFASANSGTEYLLSALEFTGGLDNRIAVWALTNTSSLSSTPNLGIQSAVVASEVYGLPPTMQQKDGSTPLIDYLKAGGFGTIPSQEHLNLLNSNDDRMNQAIYQGDHVWGALNTRVKGPTGEIRTGIAWFSVTPTWSASTLNGSMWKQGYVTAAGNNVAFPSVAVNSAGKALVAFTLVGHDYWPSAAYASIGTSPTGGTGAIKVVRPGVGPSDGFTGYLALDAGDGGVQRWGDYSAAVADADGNLWFAVESINQTCGTAQFFGDTTCGGTRSVLANWSTTIARVTPTW
jgi:hypothetical protein